MCQSSKANQAETRHSNYIKISDLVSGSERVLDVGCGSGPLCRVLRRRDERIEIVGIDKDNTALHNTARCYDRVISMDLDSFSGMPYGEGYFDAMIFADILEHLKKPEQLLREMGRYLSSSGTVVVSLPNVARIEVRMKLFLGRFNYTESGILDRTHLHFYTYSTARSLIENAGYVIDKIEYTGLGSRVRAFPRLLSYQFIIAAHPSNGQLHR